VLMPQGPLRDILDLARWAPSGDNTQPWRFQIMGPRHVVIHGFDTRSHCVYDLHGGPSQLSIGALLETLDIAASAHGLRASATRRQQSSELSPAFDVHLTESPDRSPSELLSVIAQRCVQRRAMSMRALTPSQKSQLASAVGDKFDLVWRESFSERAAVTSLLVQNAGLRLTLPEAYPVHRDVIEWGARFSETRVPDEALGVDKLTAKLMRYVLVSWPRVEFFNRYLAGTWMPRLQMDLVPGIFCGAHVAMLAHKPPVGIDDHVASGRAVQRFWLTLTRMGLWQQPEMTPLIFASYVRQGIRFTTQVRLLERAAALADLLGHVFGPGIDRGVWIGRVGAGPAPLARSMRRPLGDLLVDDAPTASRL
jgi:hypothetical protein